MSSRKPILAEDFTNHLGHVIKPGDKVVAIAQGYNHSICIREAVYVGCRKGNDYRGNERVLSVTVRAVFEKSRWNRTTGTFDNSTVERLSTLPGCRIYPLAMPLAELKRI